MAKPARGDNRFPAGPGREEQEEEKEKEKGG